MQARPAESASPVTIPEGKGRYPLLRDKNFMIDSILQEDDLYRVLGASSRTCSPGDLRRCYLERSKICHPDKPPFHPQSTSAFQKLGLAFEVLKTPSSRRSYDQASRQTPFTQPYQPDPSNFLSGEHTFRSAVEAILTEFMTGDFVLVRTGLEALNKQYPNLVSQEVVLGVERSFIRIRELVLTTRTYALLIYIELSRVHRVQKRLMGLGYLDVLGRVCLTIHLVRVTLAVPYRVDRALKLKEDREWRAKAAKLDQSLGLTISEHPNRAGILNEKVSMVLEFIVGEAANDEEVDEVWNAHTNGTTTDGTNTPCR